MAEVAESLGAPPRNIKIVVEYDGRPFCGWERQKNGLGIQEVLEEAVFRICRERVVLEGSGRTDAGVHALGQVATFRLRKPIHPEKLRLGINAVTPPEIAVISAEEVPPGFHARKSARSKLYRYTILNDRTRRPLLGTFAYHYPVPLDVPSMAAAATCFVGTHDFSAFAREARLKKSCVRTLLSATVQREGHRVSFEVEGTGFLYNMVRILTGTLIEVGTGRRDPASVTELLARGERADAGWTVPPDGLALVVVRY